MTKNEERRAVAEFWCVFGSMIGLGLTAVKFTQAGGFTALAQILGS